MTDILIHIGYPKTGTSYLQEWFSAHPNLLYRPHSLTGFYHTHDLARYAEKSYNENICHVLSDEDLSVWKGDVENIEGVEDIRFYDVKQYQTNLADTLHRLYPEAKVLIVLRGYRSYFQSLYSQYVSSGGPLDFERFKEKFGHVFPDMYDYGFMLKLYRGKFGDHNVIVMPYELLNDNPALFLSTIEKKLGLEESLRYKCNKVNASLDLKTLYAYLRLSNLVMNCIRPLPYSVRKRTYRSYIHFISRDRPHPLVRFFSRLLNREMAEPETSDILRSLKGRADIVGREELFQPYLQEYLL